MTRMKKCEFNSMVDCRLYGSDCSTCGWNPDVAVVRVEETVRRMHEEETKSHKMKYISLDDALAVVRYAKDPEASLESLPFILQ